jgi:hypothetical protein
MVVLLIFWALLGAVTKYNDANAGRTLACVLALRVGGGGGGAGRERGDRKSVQTHRAFGVTVSALTTNKRCATVDA